MTAATGLRHVTGMDHTLEELATRCEQATGPDADLDWAIIEAVNPYARWAYTASLDAAMTLVPEGMHPNIDCEPTAPEVEIYLTDNPHGAKGVSYKAATPALALCAAALRARAAAGKEDGCVARQEIP